MPLRGPALRKLAVALALTGGVAGGVAELPAATAGSPATPRVLARNLDNPRKLAVAADGSLYVVEAGHGGRDRCLGSGRNKICIGLSGAIAKVAGSRATRVVTGLWSGAAPNGDEAEGPADLVVSAGVFHVLLQDGTIDAKGFNLLGPDGADAGDLVVSRGGESAPGVLVNFAAFEAARNPDRGAGPGPKLGDAAIDSDPFALVPYRGGFAVADAAGNDLLWVSPKGAVSVLAVFPTQREKLTPKVAAQIGAPAGTASILAQSVPSSVAVGPDGALYVGELTGLPYARGSARIWRIVAGRKRELYASGFTNIVDLAFDGPNLLVLEIDVDGLLHPKSQGALIRLTPSRKRSVLTGNGLVDPAGIAVGNGLIYISNNGLFPATGPGAHGEIVTLPASLGA